MKRGFSTLEMLIAMALLISAFTVTLLLTSSQSISVDSQTSAEALTLARKSLETEQSLSRKDFKLVVATSSNETVMGTVYSKSVTVTQPDFFTKNIVAKVSWQGTYGRSPSTSLTTVITNFENAVGGDTCSTVLADSSGAHGNWASPVATNSNLGTLVADTLNPVYPVSDLDAYQGRLYVAVATSSSPVGPRNPASGVDSSAIGAITWSNPSRVTAKDGSTATLNTSGMTVSHYLKATNFGFNIPPGATILGIKVDILRNASGLSGSNAIVDNQVKIVRADGTIGSLNKASGTSWPVSPTDAFYGSASDYWGESNWTPAGINSSNFGVVLAIAGNGIFANRVASVDSIQITVYYTKQFYILKTASNPSSPTFIGGLATSTLPGSINAIAVATSSTSVNSHYAYAATDSNTGLNQLEVINVYSPATPFEVSSFPTGAGSGMGQGVGTSIFYQGGYVYEGLASGASGPDFDIIDVSNPLAPAWKGGYTVGATVNAIVVKDGYAYLSTNDLSRELIVLNITNPSSPTLVGSYNALPDISGWGFGRALYTVGDTIYLGRSWTNSSAIPQFLSLNASGVPITLNVSKSLGTNYSLRGIVVRDVLAALLLGSSSTGGQLQFVNANTGTQYAAPLALPGGASGVGGVALDCEGNYLYAASIDSSNRGFITAITGQ